MNLFALSGILIAITCSAMALFMFIRGRKPIHFLWGIFCLSVATWGGGGYLIATTGHSDNITPIELLWRSTYVGVILIPVLFTHFIYAFLKKKHRTIIYLVYICGFFFVSMNVFTEHFINDMRFVFGQFYYPIATPLFTLFFIFFIVNVLHSHDLLWKAYRHATGQQKRHLGYLFCATAIGFIGGLPDFFLHYGFSLYPLTNFLIVPFPLIIGYSIIHYHFLDIRISLQRGLFASFLFAVIIGCYFIFITLLGDLVEGSFRDGRTIITLGIITIVALTVPRIQRWFYKKTNRFFFKNPYNYATVSSQIGVIIRDCIESIDIIRSITDVLNTIFSPHMLVCILNNKRLLYNCDTFYAYNPKSHLPDPLKSLTKKTFFADLSEKQRDYIMQSIRHCIEEDKEPVIIIPILLKGKNNGAILIGEKKSGDPFFSTDLTLLENTSYQLATALEKALLYEKEREYAMSLERKVHKRTRQIKALQEEQRQAMMDISHNLQTPLTLIQSHIDTLKNTTIPFKKITTIERSISRVSRLIYDLLALSQLDIMLESPREHVNLTQLSKEALDDIQPAAQKKQIALVLESDGMIWVEGNTEELMEVLSNLLTNAIKYMRLDGLRKITITVTAHNNNAILNVHDTGIGVVPEEQTLIFHRFYRAQRTKPYAPKSTGIGLTVCKKIVESHGGDISLESVPDEGSTFTVRLPQVHREKHHTTKKKGPSP